MESDSTPIKERRIPTQEEIDRIKKRREIRRQSNSPLFPKTIEWTEEGEIRQQSNSPLFPKTIEWTEEEIRQQKQELNNLNNRKKTRKPKVPKVNNRKKFISDLLCLHSKLVRKGEYVVCINCGAKFKDNAKVKYNKGITK